MKHSPHLLVDISSHGYGHVSQTAAVVNELVALVPTLRVTLRSTAPLAFLQSRFQCQYQLIPVAFDFGMEMKNAVDVDIGKSTSAYTAFHRDWQNKIELEAQVMRELKPDFLLANIPYLSLAAAHNAGVRAVGMCCLNWADIYKHYCVENADNLAIHEQMLSAYQSAEYFLRVQPAMEMPDLGNIRNISPIARSGKSQRSLVANHCSSSQGDKLVMIAMGGMEFQLPLNNWPKLPGIRWIIPQVWGVHREDTTTFESLKLSFVDVLASCDAVITKPGYGTFTEAACAGVPVLYVTRRDWPEEPCLVSWLQKNCACLEVDREDLNAGELNSVLHQLWGLERPPPPEATGAVEAAQFLRANFI